MEYSGCTESQIYYVSKDCGFDEGEKGNIFAPYNNIWTVIPLLEDGDTIVVLDGTYVATNSGEGGDFIVTSTPSCQSLIPSTLTGGTVTFYFNNGVRIEDNSTVAQTSSHLFNITQPVNVNILGYGEFYKKQANGTIGNRNYTIIKVANANATLNFNGNLLQYDKGQVLHSTSAKSIVLNVDTIIWKGDFGLTFAQMSNSIIQLNINQLKCVKNLLGSTDYTWEALRLQSLNNCRVDVNIKYAELYALHSVVCVNARDASPIFDKNLINVNINEVKVLNDAVTPSPIINFGTLQVGGTDDVGNTVTAGTELCWIRRNAGEFTNNSVNINFNSVNGNRMRPLAIDLNSAPSNNQFNIGLGSLYSTNANGIDINTLRGSSNMIAVHGMVKITGGALINQADASFAAKLYISGVWQSDANAAIINSVGGGIVLNNFIGRGGTSVSPITTPGSGNVAVLSAGFNNTTAITGTILGATPVQNTAF